MRYNHWFWNSRLIDIISQRLCDISCWLWHKQYPNQDLSGCLTANQSSELLRSTDSLDNSSTKFYY